MEVRLAPGTPVADQVLEIGGSKSESNRLLVLQALFKGLEIENLSNSDDTRVMQDALATMAEVVDIHHAGTAMRFLTAYFATREGRELTLTGSRRMQQRPIGILVDSLRELGARIEYAGQQGYPPLKIYGKKLQGGTVSVPAHMSSQYISALLLIAPVLEKGLGIELEGQVSSRPYIDMTCALLRTAGVLLTSTDQRIDVQPLHHLPKKTIRVESDWSSASYFYALMAMGNLPSMSLRYYMEKSLQGDSITSRIFSRLGVATTFWPNGKGMTLEKVDVQMPDVLSLDLTDHPDLAQTLAVCCFGLGIGCKLGGLHTLKIKETDRLQALSTELTKLGATVMVDKDSLHLEKRGGKWEDERIETYDDHRMAMCFAPLAALSPIRIADPDVVSKSFPDFWQLLQKTGLEVEFKR